MQIPSKKLESGFTLPVFGLGTWKMGGKRERDLSNDDAADIAAIQTAINSGVPHIDTAEKYAGGYCETLVGQAIKNYNRSNLFITSKVAPEHLLPDDIRRSCEGSLTRLGTDYLDLYLIHSCNHDIPIKDSVRALEKLKREGLIKNIGVSNFSKEHLAEAQQNSTEQIVCNQVHYNLLTREVEATGLLKHCQENDVMLVAWQPLQKGMLVTGEVPQILFDMAQKYQKTPSQVALNWLISQPNVVTIAKSRALAHLEENLGSIEWQLSPDDIEKLRADYPNQQITSDTFPLG